MSVLKQFVFQMPHGESIPTVAENVRVAIENLLATGDQMWISVRGQSEHDSLTRTDYACIQYDEWKWEKKARERMQLSFLELVKNEYAKAKELNLELAVTHAAVKKSQPVNSQLQLQL